MGWAQPIFFWRRRKGSRRETSQAESTPIANRNSTPSRRHDALDRASHTRTGKAVDLGTLLESTVPALGYELVDWDMSARSRLIRVFIDKPRGVDVDDCARVSNHLTHLFAVEEVEFERLEVSSPGLDRPVKRLADYARFAGQEAQLTLSAPVNGARRIKGVLRGTEGEDVLVETDAGVKSFPFGTIARARLVPVIDWRKRT